MREKERSGRKMSSAQAEKGMLVPFALLSLLCHVAALASLLFWQQPMAKGLRSVITVDLQAVLPPESNVNGAALEWAAPTPVSAPRPPQAAPRATPPLSSAGEVREMAESPLSPRADLAVPPASPAAGTALPSIEGSGAGPTTVQPAAAADIAGEIGESAPIDQPQPAASGLGTGATGARSAYAERVRKLIEKHREYPLMARKIRMQGVVLIRCRLTRAGVPVSTEVAAPSAYPLLDQAALRAVSCVRSFPPVPPDVEGEVVVLEIPLRFRLGEVRGD